ncbi:phosphotransferase family protein [Actinomadura livida]|uniref:Aminoglycoside phosphotransferase (APT) family kinase protein n=1 Tax=Actinomadura livida TaxID=79909 RepID=A0A7W7I9N7_9ACTN|nr:MULTISPECIES: phosphotransferase family protein [Actinomadura]MBB4773109.1 aminoglycoside phosphotransferase (APT) family kinase protein [Actinomadura catellatispora]GGU18015.1 putative phosphotransferase [Actinomadura livida]
MPVPDQRDSEVTRRSLADWLERRLPGARIPHVETPQTSGFSNETLMFDAEWTGGDDVRHSERLVARVAPVKYQVFPEPRFEEQYRLMRVLDERTSIPVPPIRWYEPSADVLGAAFFVMGRIDGRVPTDMPPYHMDGWVTEAPPDERAAMWWSTLEILADLHRLDARELGLGFLDQPAWGAPGLDQRLNYYEHFLHWAYKGPQETALKALDWLKANRPDEPDEPAVLWGDARIGNVIFQEGVPAAVLDWETATLGAPEEDLAWFMFLDRHHCEGVGAPRLDGFPSYAETVARYEELLGRPMRHMAYYEILSGFKFSVVMARIGQAMIDFGWIDETSDFPYNNNCTQLLARILGETT